MLVTLTHTSQSLMSADRCKHCITIECDDKRSGEGAECLRVHDQEGSLQAVGEGHPGQVPEDQHEAKAIVDDVHGCQDSLLPRGGAHQVCVWEHNELSVRPLCFLPHLIPQSIGHIQQLETVDQDHGQRWGSAELHLLHQHAQVNDHLRATTVQL